ncbi:MAG TPA: phosphatidate cytidylyltransferase [Candidatus Limnocylindria bacterium]|nr:phosphatidate cytidylyltransferase [Candidatus Limnocylindria bacterium]
MEVARAILADPLRSYTAAALVVMVVLAGVVSAARIGAAWTPMRTWLLILPALLVPIWLGAGAWTLFVTAISIFGFKEFGRVSGLYAERPFVLVVYAGIVAINLAAYLRLDGEFLVAPFWTILVLTLVPIALNRTADTLQWFALSVVGLTFYGFFLGHLSWLAQTPFGIGPLLYVVFATQLNDVLAFLFGKRFGRRRWTTLSPNKTLEGSLLAAATTVALTFVQAPVAFPHVPPWGVLLAGLIVGIGGQVGDLTMALVKRSAGVKDFGRLLPGHGGITDRVNSLMITAPVFVHGMGFLFGRF